MIKVHKLSIKDIKFSIYFSYSILLKFSINFCHNSQNIHFLSLKNYKNSCVYFILFYKEIFLQFL